MPPIIPATIPSPAPICRVANADDIKNVRLRVGGEEAIERPDHRKPTRYEQHSGSDVYSLVAVWRVKSATCLRLRWRAAPYGDHPASKADFPGSRWPAGVVTMRASDPLNFYEAGRPEPEIAFHAHDDRQTELNETFRVEIIDDAGRIIWGDIAPKPLRAYSDLYWQNADGGPLQGGIIMTIHDTPRVCPLPRRLTAWLVQPYYYARRSGLNLERPRDQPNVQCASIPWRVEAAGHDTLRPSDFIDGHYPKGIMTFSSWATGDPDEDSSQVVPLRLKRKAVKGRKLTFVLGQGRNAVKRAIEFPRHED